MSARSNDDERALELLSRSLDDELDAAEASELERLLAARKDDATVRGILRLDATLRAARGAPSVEGPVIARLEAARRDHTEAAVVAQLERRRTPRRPRKATIAAAVVGIAALAAAAPALVRRLRGPSVDDHGESARREPSAADEAPTSPPPTGRRVPAFRPDPARPLPAPPEAAPGPTTTESPAPAAAAEIIVRRFDFEDGQLPAGFTSGEVVPGPPRPDSRYAAVGTRGPFAPRIQSIVYDPPGSVVAYDDDLVLRFWYFLPDEPGAADVRVQIYDVDQRQNHQHRLPSPVRGRWALAVIPLRALSPVRDRARRLEPGDRLVPLYIMGGKHGGAPFAIDDLAIVRSASPAQP